jgi:hypothetical protein
LACLLLLSCKDEGKPQTYVSDQCLPIICKPILYTVENTYNLENLGYSAILDSCNPGYDINPGREAIACSHPLFEQITQRILAYVSDTSTILNLYQLEVYRQQSTTVYWDISHQQDLSWILCQHYSGGNCGDFFSVFHFNSQGLGFFELGECLYPSTEAEKKWAKHSFPDIGHKQQHAQSFFISDSRSRVLKGVVTNEEIVITPIGIEQIPNHLLEAIREKYLPDTINGCITSFLSEHHWVHDIQIDTLFTLPNNTSLVGVVTMHNAAEPDIQKVIYAISTEDKYTPFYGILFEIFPTGKLRWLGELPAFSSILTKPSIKSKYMDIMLITSDTSIYQFKNSAYYLHP